MTKNKFDSLKRDELLRHCIELEDELQRLRPKPPKFKLGQLLAFTGQKNPWMRDQPAIYFTVLALEQRAQEWYYGHSKSSSSPTGWHSYAEKKCRELTKTELDGTPAPAEAQFLAQPLTQPAQPVAIVGAHVGLAGPAGGLPMAWEPAEQMAVEGDY
jgi:hypothetical protein